MQGAVERHATQDLLDLGDVILLELGKTVCAQVDRLVSGRTPALALGSGRRVIVDCQVALLEGQVRVRAEAGCPPDDLFELVHVVPGLEDVHFSHVLEVDALGAAVGHEDGLDHGALAVRGRLERGDGPPLVRPVVAVAADDRVCMWVFVALSDAPGCGPAKQRGGLEASEPGVLERHGQGHESGPQEPRVDQDDAPALEHAPDDRGDLRGVLGEERRGQESRDARAVLKLDRPSRRAGEAAVERPRHRRARRRQRGILRLFKHQLTISLFLLLLFLPFGQRERDVAHLHPCVQGALARRRGPAVRAVRLSVGLVLAFDLRTVVRRKQSVLADDPTLDLEIRLPLGAPERAADDLEASQALLRRDRDPADVERRQAVAGEHRGVAAGGRAEAHREAERVAAADVRHVPLARGAQARLALGQPEPAAGVEDVSVAE